MRKIIRFTGLPLTLLLVMIFVPGILLADTMENKVERLEKLVEKQQTQIDQLSNDQKTSVSPFKNDKVKITLYGQLNRAVLWVDDGNQSEFYNVDNDHSSTRFGLTGTAKAIKGITLGTKVELEYQANASNLVSQQQKSGIDEKLTRRHLDVYVDFAKFGKLSLGHGDTASNGTSEVDLSGTDVVGYSSISDLAGGQFFFDNSTNDLSATQIGDVYSNLDGLSRASRLRYDTPNLYGAVLSTSVLSGSGHDVALRYNQKRDAYNLAAAVAYAKKSDNETVNSSASILLKCGLNFTLAGGVRDFNTAGRDDGEFIYGKVGYMLGLFEIGKTAFSVDFGEYSNFEVNNEDAAVTGLQLVQNVDDWNTQLYLGVRNHDLDRSGYEDVNALMSGLRVKF